MKSFLITSIFCTVLIADMASAHQEAGHCGATLGTLEIWSDWMPFSEDKDLKKVCADILKAYNDLNEERGYWGQLEQPKPIGNQFRPLDGEPTERRYSCIIRVKKFDVK